MLDESETEGHHHLDEMGPVVKYDDVVSEYYIDLDDLGGGLSIRQAFIYCPACGVKLRGSYREKWFEALCALGVNPMEDEVPEPFRTSEWRRAPSDEGGK
jgi:hypothetical protein